MTKNQKMLLGVGAVAAVGYLVYKNMKGSKMQGAAPAAASFASATGMFGKRTGGTKPVWGDCGSIYSGYQAYYPNGLQSGGTYWYDCNPKSPTYGQQVSSSVGIVLPN